MSLERLKHALRFIGLNVVGRAFWVPSGLRVRLYRLCGLQIGDYVHIFPGTVVRSGTIRIGSGSFINYGCILDPGAASIELGTKVGLGPYVTLIGNSHEIGAAASRTGRVVASQIIIGDGTWVGAGVVVLPGVVIAPGCVIGAGAIVTKDTEPNGVYVGNPARRIRTIDDGEVSLLE